jgi:predicted phosphodiesterase
MEDDMSLCRVKFGVVFSLIFVLAFVVAGLQAQSKDAAIHFAIIGDRTNTAAPGIYEEIVDEIEKLCPDFVVTVGDQIEGYTNDTVILNKQWQEYKNIVKTFTRPLYYTPGNHDITFDGMLDNYKKNTGAPYYSFNEKGLHFIVLDNSRWEKGENLPKEQIDWLINDLIQNSRAAYTFVLYHKPFWYDAIARGTADTLHSIFKKYGVDAVFSGHFHSYFSGKYDGIYYTGVGSSGGSSDTGPTGVKYHFTWVTVDKNGLTIAPIKYGSVRSWDDMTVQEMHIINKNQRDAVVISPIYLDNRLNIKSNNIDVTIKNLSADYAIDDTLCWEMPSGWTITPSQNQVKIPSGGEQKISFVVQKTGELYPTPNLTLQLPYALEKKATVEAWLPVCRRAECFNAETVPLIDGLISESCWQGPVTTFFDDDGTTDKCDSSRFYFAWDENNLYLAAYCRESKPDSIKAVETNHDGSVSREDCVGYFLQPDTSKMEVYQIYFSPLGISFDQKITPNAGGDMTGDRSWNGEYEVKAQKGDSYWSIEAKIPFSQFNIKAKNGEIWKLNFRRKQFRLGKSADWQAPIDYDPKTFGQMIFK